MPETPTDRDAKWRTHVHASDVVLGGLAVLVGSASLTFPFGRDQGLYYYVAREWVRRGAVPYRDVLDHKTPGIYVLHALSILVFGENMWGIRVLDLLAVLALGWLAARAVVSRAKRIPEGVVGLSLLSSSILFFGFMNWWDTAQSEVWYGTLGIASSVSVWHITRESRAQVLGGILAGLAFAMKPPAVWFVLLALAVMLVRVRENPEKRARRSALGILRFGLGAATPLVLLAAYFGAHHALPALVDIVVGANGYYVAHEKGVSDLSEVAIRIQEYTAYYQPFTAFGLLGIVFGLGYGVRRKLPDTVHRYGYAALACGAAFAATAMQQKFYLLHWGVMVCGASVVFSAFAAEWLSESTFPDLLGTRAKIAVFACALVLGYASSGRAQSYYLTSQRSLRYATGQISREEFVGVFAWPDIHFYYLDDHRVGTWLAEHSSPDDRVAVRGFNPEIYAIANRRHQGRFFWTTFITQPSRAYRRAEWLAEDLRDLREHPPRYSVVLAGVNEGPDSATYFPGYVERMRAGELIVLERPSP